MAFISALWLCDLAAAISERTDIGRPGTGRRGGQHVPAPAEPSTGRVGAGGNGQMFGLKQQVPHADLGYQEARAAARRNPLRWRKAPYCGVFALPPPSLPDG
jgi:hypothetical protein